MPAPVIFSAVFISQMMGSLVLSGYEQSRGEMLKSFGGVPTELTNRTDFILVELCSVCLENVGSSQYFNLHRNPVNVSNTEWNRL